MNSQDVRTFRAESMQAALDVVRRELGPDAVILHTRELPQPRFLLWRRSNEKVEITAGVGINVQTPRALQQPAVKAYSAASAGSHNVSSGTMSERVAPRTSAPPQADASWPQLPLSRPFIAPAASAAPPNDGSMAPALAAEQQSAITRQLGSIQKMVEKLSQSAMARGEEIDGGLFQLYTGLIDAEVDEDLARDLICQLKQDAASSGPLDPSIAKRQLAELVESKLRVAAPIRPVRGRRRVVALVGPTGVGKTTTIAKLAANFRLRDGVRLGLVTVDTYRIAAVEQLRTYAEIIDLPMKVVTGPREMSRALDELAGLDLILIDTAGRSPRDELKIQELKSLFAEAQVDEVHLVLSLASSVRSLAATAEKFAAAGTTAMILTKLDEAVTLGPLLSVAHHVPLPVSYLTTGQDVPDDIEPAGTRRMARLILGEETLNAKR